MYSNLSNFNYKPQTESQRQHLAFYTERHLRKVATIDSNPYIKPNAVGDFLFVVCG